MTAASLRRPRPSASLPVGAALVALLLTASQAVAQDSIPDTLSLSDALALAREHNPVLLQQKNDVGVARASVRAAYGSLLPTVHASSGFGYTAAGEARFGAVEFGRRPDYYSSDYSLSMGMQLSGARLLQPSVERSQRTAIERRVAGTEAQLEAQVAQQYLSVLQAREQVTQAEREVARTAEHVRLAEARLEVGVGTPLDVQRAQVQHGRAQVSLVQATNTADIAALTLGQLVGVPIDPSVHLTSEFRIFQPAWRAEELVESALQQNPTLLAAQASVSAAETSVKSARTQYLPSLNFQVGLRGWAQQAGDLNGLVEQNVAGLGQRFQSCQVNNDLMALVGRPQTNCSLFDPSNPAVVAGVREQLEAQNSGWPFDYTRQPMSASLSVSLPIFQGFNRQLQVDQAKAAAADARHQTRAEQLRLRQEVSTAVRNLQTSYETARLQEQVVRSATEELRLAQERFRFGAANSIEVTDAQTNLAEAERARIDAVYNFHKSLAALEALIGRPLR